MRLFTTLFLIDYQILFQKKRNFEGNFSAKIEQSGWMKTNMAATSNHPQIFSLKYGQMGNVKLLTANHSLLFAVKWPNLDLKVSIIISGMDRQNYWYLPQSFLPIEMQMS